MTERDKILEEGLAAARKNNYEGIILLPTGTGKGRLMIEIAKEVDPQSVLYTCNSVNLRESMFVNELNKWDAAHLIPRTERHCYQTAYTFEDRHYNMLLADEFDFSLSPEYIKLYENNTFDHRILVSATLSAKKRGMLKKLDIPIIYERKQQEVINAKVLNQIQFYFINYDLNAKENYQYLEFNNEFKGLLQDPSTPYNIKKLEQLAIRRMQFLSQLDSSVPVAKWLLGSLAKRQQKVLLFGGSQQQVDRICTYTYHGGNNRKDLLESFDRGEILELGVVDKIERGMNIAEIRNIVHESMGGGKEKFTQRNGRGMRLEAHEILNAFILVPYFWHPFRRRQPTIVKEWAEKATSELDMSKAKIIEFTK